MIYKQITPYIHLIAQPVDRKKIEMEIVWSSGGSWFEQSSDRGKKHLMEHCIASRTKEMNFEALKDFEFRENIFINAYTGPLSMGLNASGHYSDFRKVVDTLLEMAFEPTFDQSILDQEKEIVLREISERRGDPNYRLHYTVVNKVFTLDSYENHEVLGDKDMVAATSIQDFQRLHLENMQGSHLVINVSGGGIDLEYLEQKVRSFLQNPSPQIQALLDSSRKKLINFEAKNQLNDFGILPIVDDLAHSHAELTIYIPCTINFESKPGLKIFEELFLKFYGVLYDKLRNQMGLIYSMYSSFQKDLQVLSIQLACEIQYVDTILQEIDKTFADFEAHFSPEKFQDFKQMIKKKIDLSQDSLGSATSFIQNSLFAYAIPENLDEYATRLDNVTKEDIQAIYTQIQTNLPRRRVVVVSKDSAITSFDK